MMEDDEMNYSLDDDLGAPIMDDLEMQEDMEDEDQQIEKIADSYARRTTDRGGRRKVPEVKITRFNVRPKQDDDPDEDCLSQGHDDDEDGDQPKRKGRPPGLGRKEKDFEE